MSDIISQQNSDTIFLPVNFVKNSSTLQTYIVQRILLQHGVDHSDRTQQYYILGKKSFEVFSEQKTLALGLLSVLLYWLATPEPVMSAVDQTVKAQKSGSRVSSTGLPGAKHIKALASPSLPESSACKSPCEFMFCSKLHVPADQCDTIRSWLCVNQMMTAWLWGCLACCHSPVANPLPQENCNWFPGCLWESCFAIPPWDTEVQLVVRISSIYIHSVI